MDRGILVLLCLLLILSHSKCTRLLLIGDSIDRLSVQEYCDEHHYYSEIPPFHEPLKTSNKAVDAYYCKALDNSNHSLAYLHIHGSNSTRPYWMDHTRAHVELENSIDRLNYGIVKYMSTYPVPHFIFLHTAQWDAAQLNYVYDSEEINKVHSTSWNISVSSFISSMRERIEQIQSLVRNVTTECGPVKLGLRTAIYSPKFQKSFIPTLLFEMNRLVVELSREYNLILYDANEDFWSRHGHNYAAQAKLFRDYIHPIRPLLVTQASKLMRLQYTSYYTNPVEKEICSSLPIPPSLWLSPKFSVPSHLASTYQKIVLISSRSKDDVYFVEYKMRENKTVVTSHRYANKQFQSLVSLGESDIYYIAEDVASTSLVEGAYIPPLFRSNSSEYRYLVNCSFFTDAYVVDKKLKWRKITFPMIPNEVRDYHAWDTAIDCNEFQHFHHFLGQEVIQSSLISHELPDIYRSNVLARYHVSTEIFAMLNGTRRSIANMDVFNAHDWDINHIVVVHDMEDLEVIPVGPTLTE